MEAVATSLNGDATEEPLVGLVIVMPPEVEADEVLPEPDEVVEPDEDPDELEPDEVLEPDEEPDVVEPDEVLEPDEEPDELEPDEVEPEEPVSEEVLEPDDVPEPEEVVEPDEVPVPAEAAWALGFEFPQPVLNTVATLSRHTTTVEFFMIFTEVPFKIGGEVFRIGVQVGVEAGACFLAGPQPFVVSKRARCLRLPRAFACGSTEGAA